MGGAPFWGLNADGVTCNEGPTYCDDPWDTFWINEIQMPGRCELVGSPGGFEVEKYKGKNQTGASIKMFGYLPGQFDLLVEISTPDQWDAMQEVEDAFWPGPQKDPIIQGLTLHVRHPDLQRLRVEKAMLFDLPLAEKSPLEGAKIFRWKFNQTSLPKPTRTFISTGPLPPEDPRLPPANATPKLPSSNPANASLDGPPLSTNGGAL